MVHNLFALFCYGVGNGPVWTLGLEEQLYLLYIPLLALRRARTIVTVLAVSLAWQVGWRFVLGVRHVEPAEEREQVAVLGRG